MRLSSERARSFPHPLFHSLRFFIPDGGSNSLSFLLSLLLFIARPLLKHMLITQANPQLLNLALLLPSSLFGVLRHYDGDKVLDYSEG